MKHLKTLLLVIIVFITQSAFAGFNQWTGSGPFTTGIANQRINTITISGDGKTVYTGTGSGTVFNYNFGYLLKVSVPSGSSSGSGQVTNITGDITCNSGTTGVCSVAYVYGSLVTLTAATTALDSTFDGWADDCSGIGTCSFTMTTDKKVTALFGLGPNNEGPKAKIASTGYNSISDAYRAAGSNSTILAIAGVHTLVYPLLMDRNINILLKGGYDSSFTNTTGQWTFLQGPLAIDSGNLRMDYVKIRSSN